MPALARPPSAWCSSSHFSRYVVDLSTLRFTVDTVDSSGIDLPVGGLPDDAFDYKM